MKWLNYYSDNNLNSDNDVFEYLTRTMRPGVADWDYFVAWDKVFANTRKVEVTLNTMNYLLGKDNFDSEFKYLAASNPEILRLIPVLIVRNGGKSSNYSVVTVEGTTLTEERFEFKQGEPSAQNIEDAVTFIKNSGLIRIFEKDGVKNLVDYVLGVEAGLSSNGRKNRGGTAMENVCEALLKNLECNYIRQASPADIEHNFGINLESCDGRIFGFAVMGNNGLNVIEVNCYSSGGSKLDKTASDYKALQDDLRGQATFTWLTDGAGWQKAKNPLRKTYDYNDYILNICMIEQGAFQEIINS